MDYYLRLNINNISVNKHGHYSVVFNKGESLVLKIKSLNISSVKFFDCDDNFLFKLKKNIKGTVGDHPQGLVDISEHIYLHHTKLTLKFKRTRLFKKPKYIYIVLHIQSEDNKLFPYIFERTKSWKK